MVFKYEWTGTRVPKTVVFPNGQVETTQYMRDGLIMFMSGLSGSYERIDPNYSATFMIHESKEDKIEGLNSYLSKQ